MTSYEGLRKLTVGDKPVVIKWTNLRVPISQVPTYDELCFMVQRLFRAELSKDLDNLVLRYEDEDKATHPIVVPVEHLSKALVGLDEKQTITAVTGALADLHERIGSALQVIRSQHPTAATSAQGGLGTFAGAAVKSTFSNGAAAENHKAVDAKPLVLSAESLDQLLEPSKTLDPYFESKKKLLARQLSISSQSSTLPPAASPALGVNGGTPSVLSNATGQFHPSQQQQQQQSLPQHQQQQQQHGQQPVQSQQWTPQTAPVANGLSSSISSPAPMGGQQMQPLQQQPLPQQHQQYGQPFAQPQQQPYTQYTSAVVPQQQQQQPLQQVQQQQVQQRQPVPQQIHHQSQMQSQPGSEQPQTQVYAQPQVQQLQHQQQQLPQQQQQQQQQQLPQQPAQQQQQTPYMQPAYATGPYNQQQPQQRQQQQNATPFMRANMAYLPEQHTTPLAQGYASRA
ncbi:hypothetical protein BGZ70_010130 [Mortierella alpina]|uniref:PB1 domain-containing protein n=1 Tax=Mortierella alpina TaxID=64518 RepID=A0A9P6IZY1_MORAP|nr:hypothetical protein BGZ70_010130 [Mortierella alpina]